MTDALGYPMVSLHAEWLYKRGDCTGRFDSVVDILTGVTSDVSMSLSSDVSLFQAVTTPCLAVSHIMLESYKKYIVVSLIVHGKVSRLLFIYILSS